MRFSTQLGCRPYSQSVLGHHPSHPMGRKQPLPRKGRQVSRARVNLLVRRQEARYSLWSTGLYRTSRRRYGFGIFESSTTTRTPPPRRNPTLLTVKSMRVAEAEDSVTLGHLPCTKTTEMKDKEKFKKGRKEEEEIMNEEKEEEEKEEEEEEGEEEEEEEGEEEEEEEEDGDEEEEEEEEEVEEKEEVEEAEEEKEEEKREVKKEEKSVAKKEEKEEKKEEEQERQGEDNKEKAEKEEWCLLKETEGQDNEKRGSPSSHVQRKTSRPLAAKAEVIYMRQTYGPQEGSQHPQGLPQCISVTALVCPRKYPYGFYCPSSLSPDRHSPSLGQAGEDAPGCLEPVSGSGSTHQEAFLKKDLERTGLPGSADSQEPQKEKLVGNPQATVPGRHATPVPALKNPHKRKAARLELLLPPSEPLPPPTLLQQLWEQADLPPPPKIPRIDTETDSDARKNMKGQAIRMLNEKVDVLRPKTQLVSVHSAPQPVLPSLPPPASEPAASLSLPTDGVSSLGPPASTPLLCQTAGPPTPSVPAPALTPSIPTVPITPPALPSDSGPPCGARFCVETPPAVKKDPTDLPTALAPAGFHLPTPGPEPLSFNPPSCKRELPTPVCISSHPCLFPATFLGPSLRNSPTVFPTTAPHACEDMSWEPSSGSTEMDMDTTPPSEASILSSSAVNSGSSLPFVLRYGCMQEGMAANATMSIGPPAFGVPCHTPCGNNLYTPSAIEEQKQGASPAGGDPGVWIQPGLVPAFPPMAATTPSHPAMDFEFMDTTPPSKAVILHSSPAADHISNSLPPQSVWGHTTALKHTGATSRVTPALLNRTQPGGWVFVRKPSTSTAAAGLTSLSGKQARGSKTQPRFAGSTSPANRDRPYSTKLSYGKILCDSNITTPISGFTLSSGMGSGDCSSPSTSSPPSTPVLMRPVVPQRRKNSSHDMHIHECASTPRYQVVKQKGKGGGSVQPIILKRCQ